MEGEVWGVFFKAPVLLPPSRRCKMARKYIADPQTAAYHRRSSPLPGHTTSTPSFPRPYLFIQKLKAANAPAIKGEVNQEMITGTKPLK